MLRRIKIVPLAAESLGARSMCTFIETPEVRVLLDAGVSLCPYRWGLPPHPKEYQAIIDCRKSIAIAAEKSEIVTISHYHFDHHTPSYTDWLCNWSSEENSQQIYEGKLVLAKNYKTSSNLIQRRRGWVFAKTGGKNAKKIEYVDGKAYDFGRTCVKFSEPVFHGKEHSHLGLLVMTTVERENERFLFASDVQGPIDTVTLKKILAQKPQVVLISGPPVYLGDLIEEWQVNKGLENLEILVRNVPIIILEHHLLRKANWPEFAASVLDAGKKRAHSIVTAAKFLNRNDNLLEANRKLLFDTEPPDPEFEKWMKRPMAQKKLVRPPV